MFHVKHLCGSARLRRARRARVRYSGARLFRKQRGNDERARIRQNANPRPRGGGHARVRPAAGRAAARPQHGTLQPNPLRPGRPRGRRPHVPRRRRPLLPRAHRPGEAAVRHGRRRQLDLRRARCVGQHKRYRAYRHAGDGGHGLVAVHPLLDGSVHQLPAAAFASPDRRRVSH